MPGVHHARIIERVFDAGDRRVADEVRKASDRLRALARKATPGVWRAVPASAGGDIHLLGRDGQQFGTLTGVWAPDSAGYITAMAPATAYLVAEVMWLSDPVIRQGKMPSPLRAAFQNLARNLPGE